MTMRSVVIATRVRGPLRVGGANEKARDTMNHGCRVASAGAPSPGIRALHARIPTSPRKRLSDSHIFEPQHGAELDAAEVVQSRHITFGPALP